MHQSERRPLNAKYRNLSRVDAIALVTAYTKIYGLARLRNHWNFRAIGDDFLDPDGYDRHDLWCALHFIVDEVNAAPDNHAVTELRKSLHHHLGALDKPIAVMLNGRGRFSGTIEPAIWLQEARRSTLSKGDVVQVVDAYGKVRGLESLRDAKPLHQLTFIDPVAFAPDEQMYALTYIIDAVNAAPDDKAMVKVGKRLKRHFSAMNLPILVSLQGFHAVLQPQAAMH